MGFLDKLMGKKEEYQPLPADHAVMPRLQSDLKGLEEASAQDRPTGGTAR